MSTKDDGGPAFPLYAPSGRLVTHKGEVIREAQLIPGMNLRQWYAGQVLGECLHEAWNTVLHTNKEMIRINYAVQLALRVADAMIAEGKK